MGAMVLCASALADETAVSVAQQCLPHPSIKRTKVLGDQNILFITKDDAIYNNQLPRQCPTMRRNSVLNYSIDNGRVCAGSKFTVLLQVGTSWMPGFVCQLGMFVPISEDEMADLIALSEESSKRRRGDRPPGRDLMRAKPIELPSKPSEPAP